MKYKTLITTAGAAKFAAATASGTKITLSQMAVGDGGGSLPVPDVNQTTLIGEKWREPLNKISVDVKHKNYVVAELVIPPEVGGFWLREMGLYDADGTLVAVSNMAESYKPELAEGSGRAQTLRMVIIISSLESVELSIDTTTVMATQDYVDDKLAEHEQSRRHPDATLSEKGFTQLNSATDSESETQAATPKAVKSACDLADRASKNADARLAKNSNLADVADKAQAREQLELKTAAQRDVQTSRNDATPGRVLINGGTFAVSEKQVEIHAGDCDFRFTGQGDFSAPGTVSAASVRVTTALNIGDDDSGLLANGDGNVLFRANSVTTAGMTSQEWKFIVPVVMASSLTVSAIELKGGPAVIDFHQSGDNDDYNVRLYNDAKNQLRFIGSAANPLFRNDDGQFLAKGSGGSWGFEYGRTDFAPFSATTYFAPGGDAWCPLIKGEGYKSSGYITSTAFGYYIPANNTFNNPAIFCKNDNGTFGYWAFGNQDGNITYSNAGGSRYVAFQDWVSQVFASQAWLNVRISDVQNWVNGNFCTIPQRDQINSRLWAIESGFVRGIRFGAVESVQAFRGPGYGDALGYVLTGAINFNTDDLIDTLTRRPLQININGNWMNVGG